MAKRSLARAIRGKSKGMYPTAGTKKQELLAIHQLYKTNFGPGKSDDEYDLQITGGFVGKACPKCFVKFSINGQCNCS